MTTLTVKNTAAAIIMAAACLYLASCSGSKKNEIPADALVQIGDKVLTRSMLDREMPGGIGSDDSTRFANAYIRSWIDSELISQIAAEEIDMTEIDRLVDQYRKDLIMWEYGRRMYDSHSPETVSEDSLRAYYDSHPREFVLDRPMVKGIYLKVPENSRNLRTLRRLYRSTRAEDIDELEKSELNGAVHYDFFRDRWVDWEQIESLIPYDFGDADRFLAAHDHVDFTKDGFTYLLDISDVLHSGRTMPFEAASERISDRFDFRNRRAYDSRLREDLYQHSLENGRIKLFTQNN